MQQNSINSTAVVGINGLNGMTATVSNDNDQEAQSSNIWNNVDFLVGDNEIVERMQSTPALPPFNDRVTAFLAALSEKLMKGNRFSDITTFAFWIRRANLIKLKQRFGMDRERMVRIGNIEHFKLGRGTVFHIAPSNVPVNFAYSLVASLLMGNSSIVRVPSKDFDQVRIITTAINQVLDEGHEEMKPYLACVSYESQSSQAKAINDLFSSLCDVRVIWGGDRTIATLRQSPLPPRSTEVLFADRYSLCVIDADEYINLKDTSDEKLTGQNGRKQTEKQQAKQQVKQHNQKLSTIAYNFFNDTYLTDQNACTSPKVIIWTGKQVKKARKVFWDYLHSWVKGKYKLQAVQSVDKLTRAYIEAATAAHLSASSKIANLPTWDTLNTVATSAPTSTAEAIGIEVAGIKIEKAEDNLITRVLVPSVDILTAIKDGSGFNNNSGYFYEYVCKNSDSSNSLMELCPLFNDKRCQTVSYIGDTEKLFTGLLESGVKGIDRIVPIGATMDFDLLWDGYNLLSYLTRTVSVL